MQNYFKFKDFPSDTEVAVVWGLSLYLLTQEVDTRARGERLV